MPPDFEDNHEYERNQDHDQDHDYEYILVYEKDGHEEHIGIDLEQPSKRIRVASDFQPPDWALLDYKKCTHCTLSSADHLYCPIARNLAYLLHDVSLGTSHERIALRVKTPVREYAADTTLQRALSSLFGLISSLSDCPHTRPLRPMGIFHLPVATETETLTRVTAFFLLQAYLDHLDAGRVTVDLGGMSGTYHNLKTLNRCFVERLRGLGSSDAHTNALVLLDILTRDVEFEVGEELGKLRKLFDFDRDT